MHAGLLGELRPAAVLVEARHGKPAVCGDIRRVGHGNPAVCVAGVADNEHADIVGGILFYGLPLPYENLAVYPEQVGALHALLAGDAADEKRPVGALEPLVEVAGRHYAVKQRESAVVELHLDAFKGFHSGLDFNEIQFHGLVGAEYGAACDSEQEGVADLSGGSGYCDSYGFFHLFVSL